MLMARLGRRWSCSSTVRPASGPAGLALPQGNSRAIQRRLHLWQTPFPIHPSCLPNLDIHYQVCPWMQLLLLGHSFFCFPFIPLFSLSSHLTLPVLISVCVWRRVNEPLLFLLSRGALKDAEQQRNNGGSALIKYSNLLSFFCCGSGTSKINEALSNTQRTHYIYIWGWLW